MELFYATLFEKLIYPLAVSAANWLYANIIIKKTEDELEVKQEERLALAKAVQNAQTNEERRLLSISISKLNRLSIDRYRQIQREAAD